MVRLAQTVHLPCNDTNTLSKQIENEILLEPHHLELSWGASKRIYEHLIHSVETAHLSCVKIGIVSKQTETSSYLGIVT
jgi:DNA-binding protein Fis